MQIRLPFAPEDAAPYRPSMIDALRRYKPRTTIIVLAASAGVTVFASLLPPHPISGAIEIFSIGIATLAALRLATT